MIHILSCAIARVSDHRVVKIPRSAWAAIERIAEEEFGATVSVDYYDEPCASDGVMFVPYAHYLFMAEHKDVEFEGVERFQSRVLSLIDALVESHTQQSAGR